MNSFKFMKVLIKDVKGHLMPLLTTPWTTPDHVSTLSEMDAQGCR